MLKSKSFIRITIAIVLTGITAIAWSAEPSFKQDEPLNGITVHYKYTEKDWEFEVSFYDDKVLYYWLQEDKERPTKPTNKDIPYHAKRIGENMYMVNWHEENLKDVVTLVINFDTSTLYGAGILRYNLPADERMPFYHGAIIQSVRKD